MTSIKFCCLYIYDIIFDMKKYLMSLDEGSIKNINIIRSELYRKEFDENGNILVNVPISKIIRFALEETSKDCGEADVSCKSS